MSKEYIQSKTTADLRVMLGEIQDVIKANNEVKDLIIRELLNRYGEKFITEFKAAGKSDGSLTREFDGLKMTYEQKAKVTWDEAKLRELLANRPELADTVVKVKLTVPEKVWSTVAETNVDAPLKSSLSAARTVEYGDPKITFKD